MDDLASTTARLPLLASGGGPDNWRPPVETIWHHPVIGGSSDGAPVLAVIGTMAWLVGTLAAAAAVRRTRGSWLATAALVVSAFALFVFRTHAWPGGPISFGALAVAAAHTAKAAGGKPDEEGARYRGSG